MNNNERIAKGTEHGVEWEVNSSKFHPVVISVRNVKTGEKETKVYNCMYKPIFGYDVADKANVNKILDDLIRKYADDGYGKS